VIAAPALTELGSCSIPPAPAADAIGLAGFAVVLAQQWFRRRRAAV